MAVLNLILIFFNLSYIPYRDFYLQVSPGLVHLYDPIKGIRPHPETTLYLDQVQQLERQVSEFGLVSPQVAESLVELRQFSSRLITENPFAGADKNHTLGKIAAEIRAQTGERFTRAAFERFWSQDYLLAAGWQPSLQFWNAQIRPLIQTNYERGIDRFGRSTDYFWLLDLPFVLFFAVDLCTRTLAIRRTYPQLTWLEAVLRRWYDLVLVLPFLRWLRVVPVSLRLYNVGLLNLEPVQAQIHRDVVIGFALELTEMVALQVIDQIQSGVQQGDALQWLFHPDSRQPYVQSHSGDEITALATRFVDLGVKDVLPQVQPQIEDLMQTSINSSLKQIPVYDQLRHLPGLGHLPGELTAQLAQSLSQTVYGGLSQTLSDPVVVASRDRLNRNFQEVLERELRHNLQDIQALLVDLLEDVKLSFVQGLAEVGIEEMVEEAEQLHRRISLHKDHRPVPLIRKGE